MNRLTSVQAALLAGITVLVLGAVLQIMNLRSLESHAAMLRVGVDSPFRPLIEAQLGEIPLTEGNGHDGQFFFVSARDPFALDDQWTDVYQGYRHRRVGYPLLAGLGGLLAPHATLLGLAIVPVLAMAAAAASAVMLVVPHRREWAIAAVVANPGLWMSSSLATGDTLALASGMAAMVALRRHRLGMAIGLLVLAGFSKETHLIFAGAAGLWLIAQRRWRDAALAAGIPTGLFAGWMVWLEVRAHSDGVGFWNFDWPAIGIWEAAEGWAGNSAVLIGAALVGVIVAVIGMARTKSLLMRLTLAPWMLVALMSSEIVWREGNNTARVMAPLLTLGVVALFMSPDDGTDIGPPTEPSTTHRLLGGAGAEL